MFFYSSDKFIKFNCRNILDVSVNAWDLQHPEPQIVFPDAQRAHSWLIMTQIRNSTQAILDMQEKIITANHLNYFQTLPSGFREHSCGEATSLNPVLVSRSSLKNNCVWNTFSDTEFTNVATNLLRHFSLNKLRQLCLRGTLVVEATQDPNQTLKY